MRVAIEQSASADRNRTPGTLADRPARARLATLVAGGAGITGGHLGTSTLPFQVGALIDYSGISPSQAGLFGGIEVAGLATAMIVSARYARLVPPRTTALVGAALAMGACLLLSRGAAMLGLLVYGLIAGAGFGLLYAGSIAALSRDPNSTRFFAIGTAMSIAILTCLTALIPRVVPVLGTLAPFMVLSGVLVLLVPALAQLRSTGPTEAPPDEDAPEARRLALPHYVLLLTWAGFSCGGGAVWIFVERLGRGIGMSPAAVGMVLSAGVVCGLIGSYATAYLSERIARSKLLGTGLVLSALDCVLLSYASNPVMFAVAIGLYWATHMLLYSTFLGTAASMDPVGRLGVLAGGSERMAFALGTWLGGLIAQELSFAATGWIGLVAGVAGTLFGLPVVMRHFNSMRH